MAFALFGQAVTVIITITPSATVLSPRLWTVRQCEILGLTVISSSRIFFRRQVPPRRIGPDCYRIAWRGKVTVKVVPGPGLRVSSTEPLWDSAIHFTIDRPRPKPPS